MRPSRWSVTVCSSRACADAADHAAEGLAVGELGADDAARVVHAEHPPHPHQAQRRVDGRLRRRWRCRRRRSAARARRPVRRSRPLRGGCGRCGPAAARRSHRAPGSSVTCSRPLRTTTSSAFDPVQRRLAVLDGQLDRLSADLVAGVEGGGADAGHGHRAAVRRGRRIEGVAQPEGDRAHGQPEGVRGDLGLGGVRARAHVAGGGLDERGAVGVQPGPGLGGHARGVVDAGGHAPADQPVPVTRRAGPGVAPVPAELAGADGVALAQPAGGERQVRSTRPRPARCAGAVRSGRCRARWASSSMADSMTKDAVGEAGAAHAQRRVQIQRHRPVGLAHVGHAVEHLPGRQDGLGERSRTTTSRRPTRAPRRSDGRAGRCPGAGGTRTRAGNRFRSTSACGSGRA